MKKSIDINLVASALGKLSDEELSSLQLSMPWQVNLNENDDKDVDGFKYILTNGGDPNRAELQKICRTKFNESPFVGTSVRGQVGRLTGKGFEVSSDIYEIQEFLEEVEYDPRNRLYINWSKYVGGALIDGELFLLLTCHKDGFIEVDYIDPAAVNGGGEDGVLYHPQKTTMPLFYFVTVVDKRNAQKTILVPSIYMAYYPSLIKNARESSYWKEELAKESRNPGNIFNKIGGYNRFIVAWDRSFVTRRNVGYLRTVLVWLNHYENLKKYEIDHKKSSGAYLWVVKIEDPKSFRLWLSLSDEERAKTGIMAKKTPGSMLVLPPGMTIEAINPKLNTISEQDTDILHLVTGGLNEPEDISTGQSKGTFASVKASRGPMSDRTSDEISYFEKFLKFDFYRPVFFLKSKISSFPETFKVHTAVDYKSKKPVFKEIDKKPEFLIDIAFPVSEVIDAETRARAYLGVKHGSIYDTLGIPNDEIAKRLGFGNYKRLRLQQATEEDRFPELSPPVDVGGQQLDQDGKSIKKTVVTKPEQSTQSVKEKKKIKIIK